MFQDSRMPFLNCHFDNLSFDQVLQVVDEHVHSRDPGFMVSLNVDIVVRLEKDECFKEAFDAADIVLMDSQPLTNICRSNGIDVKEKLSGSDLMPRICEHAAKNGYRCFILGGADGIPDRACENLQSHFPGLMIEGFSPEYGFEKKDASLSSIIRVVNDYAPDILFICLGTPKSEKILYPRINQFDVPFAFSVGAAVDFAAGNVKRAPIWMQRFGLEWLFRFSQEPKRLFKRYFIDSWALIGIVKRTGFRNENRD